MLVRLRRSEKSVIMMSWDCSEDSEALPLPSLVLLGIIVSVSLAVPLVPLPYFLRDEYIVTVGLKVAVQAEVWGVESSFSECIHCQFCFVNS